MEALDDNTKKDKSLSFKDIGMYFSDIDKKILSLHQCSSDDFLTFNNQLKEYYNQIQLVSSNAQNALSLSEGKVQFETQNGLDLLLKESEQYLSFLLRDIDNYIIFFEKILKNVSSLVLYVKNYKQNLLTYKYIVSNFRINLAYLNQAEYSIVYQEIEKMFLLVTNINAKIPLIEENLNHLRVNISECVIVLKRLSKQYSENANIIIQDFVNTRDNVQKYSEETKSFIDQFTKKIDACSSNVNKIITNLQFQDIVRQKVEHIQKMHKEVLGILNDFEDKQIEALPVARQARYVVQIRDITELQIAQLYHTNKEYQKAIEHISKMFLIIIENITDASLLNVFLPNKLQKKPADYRDIFYKNLSRAVSNIEEIEKDYIQKKLIVESAFENIHHISSEIIEIKNKHNELIQLSFHVVETIKTLDAGTFDQKNLINYINTLLITNKVFIRIVSIDDQNKKYIEQWQQHISISKNERDSHSGFESISQKTNDLINLFSHYSKDIQTILSENEKILNRLIDEMFTSLQSVKYYDFFEKVIEEIIQNLNRICSQLSIDYEHKNHIKKSILQQFKDQYSMESERNIHSSVIASADLFDLQASNEIDEDQNQGDLELF